MKRIENISFEYNIRQITALFLSIWLFFGPSIVSASLNPVNDALPSGIINRTGVNAPVTGPGFMEITQTASEAIIKWQNFDIGVDSTVQFTQPGVAAAVLNRIHDGSPTGIMGQLQANGRVFIVNPAGVVFGPSSQVNVAQLIASSLDIADPDFLNGVYNFSAVAGGMGSVENYGKIDAEEAVLLLGKSVLNAGTIVTEPGGLVAMAAGDRLVLGQSGSNITIELVSAAGTAPGIGDVINSENGQIEAPGGTVVLASGDIFALAGSTPRTVKVHLGTGQVVQDGLIDASAASDGENGGTVSLTSGENTTLGSLSITAANAGDGGDSGIVTVHSKDNVAILPAQIEATGGYTPEPVETDPAPLSLIQQNSVEIIGNSVSIGGDIYATASDPAKKGKIYIEAANLAIVDELPAGPVLVPNTISEEFVEDNSQNGVELELVANAKVDGTIIVEGMGDTVLEGGSGDISLRSLYDNGGIIFLPDSEGELTTIHTTYGGNIFMSAGSGGIVTGDLHTDDSDDSSHTIEAGRIRLITSNTGNMNVGTMVAEGGNITEISAISAGDLTLSGGAVSLNGAVNQQDDKTVGFARICLVADGDIVVDSSTSTWRSSHKQIRVDAHGKLETVADIRICAGGDLTLILAQNPDAPINASAQSSQQTDLWQNADAHVLIGAGHEQTDPGVISLNGDTNPANFEIDVDTRISGEGALHIDPQDTADDYPPVGAWHEIVDVGVVGDDKGYRNEVELIINPNVDNGYICADCPKPPKSTMKVIANDDGALEHMSTLVNTLLSGETSVLANDQGEALQIAGWTQPEDVGNGTPIGTVVFNHADGTFSYDPEPGYVGTVEFDYVVIDVASGLVDNATVTIDMTNALPYANDGSASGPINVATSIAAPFGDNPDLLANGEQDALMVQVESDPAFGSVSFDDQTGMFTYIPAQGNTTGTDSFTYSVSDGQLGTAPQMGTVTINLTNQDPIATDNSYGTSHNIELLVNAANGAITGTVPAGADFDPDNTAPGMLFSDTLTVTPIASAPTANGGTVTLDADGSFTYTPSPGNTSGTDSFVYTLNDGFGGSDTATVTITLENLAPIAQPDVYSTGLDVPLTVTGPDDLITGVIPAINADIDPDNQTPGRLFDDTLTSFLPGGVTSGSTAFGGTVTLNGDGTFTYIPPAGFTDTDNFTYYVTDGYANSESVQVTITVSSDPTQSEGHLPGDPLPALLKEPEIEGCPALLDAVATELGATSETIQVSINRSLATAPNIQPCNACARFMDYAGILSDPDGSRIAAMVQMFNDIAPAHTPPSEEMFASITTTFSRQLENEEMPQYAAAMEFLDAFVGYISILDNELGSPVGDSTAFALGKHGGTEITDNPNIVAYVQTRLANTGQWAIALSFSE